MSITCRALPSGRSRSQASPSAQTWNGTVLYGGQKEGAAGNLHPLGPQAACVHAWAGKGVHQGCFQHQARQNQSPENRKGLCRARAQASHFWRAQG